MGGESDRSDQHCQIESRLQVSIDSDRRVSKYAWVEPVKSKTGNGKILKLSPGRQPQNLQTDDGKEFYNKHF